MICPTAWGRGQLEWDSGQLAQRGQQTGAGDCGFSSSLIACRFLRSFCDPCTLEVTMSKQRPLTEAEAAGKTLLINPIIVHLFFPPIHIKIVQTVRFTEKLCCTVACLP